jgi:hypothetical protein
MVKTCLSKLTARFIPLPSWKTSRDSCPPELKFKMAAGLSIEEEILGRRVNEVLKGLGPKL